MKAMLSKEEFVAHLNGLQKEFDATEVLYRDFGIDTIEMNWCYSMHHFVGLLSQMMHDEYENISWWCYETDFGRDESMRKIYIDGEPLDLKTPEDLYDYLIMYISEEDEDK